MTNADANTVTKVNRATGSIVDTIDTGRVPYGITYDGTNMWVVNGPYQEQGSVQKISKSGVILGTYPTYGLTSRYVIFDGTNILVSNASSSDISKLRASDGAILFGHKGTAGSMGLLYEGRQVWTAGELITRFDADSGLIINQYKLFNSSAYEVAFDGKNIWIAMYDVNKVVKLASK